MEFFEKQISSQRIFDGKIIGVRKDVVELQNGKQTFREVVEHSGGVCVAALDDEKNMLFVRQFRYPNNSVILEVPAGKLNPGEDHFECGKRELEEETGYLCSEYRHIATVYPSPAYLGEIIHIYFASGLTMAKQKLDEGEFLAVEKIPLDKAFKMVMNDEIYDAKTQIAVLKVKSMADRGEI